jgi:hypothetical protein
VRLTGRAINSRRDPGSGQFGCGVVVPDRPELNHVPPELFAYRAKHLERRFRCGSAACDRLACSRTGSQSSFLATLLLDGAEMPDEQRRFDVAKPHDRELHGNATAIGVERRHFDTVSKNVRRTGLQVAGEPVLMCRAQLRRHEHVRQLLSDNGRSLDAERLFRPLVHVDDSPGAVHHDDAIERRLE